MCVGGWVCGCRCGGCVGIGAVCCVVVVVIMLDYWPVLETVLNLDISWIVPPELSCMTNPGWLWTNAQPSHETGYSLTSPLSDIMQNIIRNIYVEKVEQYCPFFTQQVQKSQRFGLGILGGLAYHGTDGPLANFFFEGALKLLKYHAGLYNQFQIALKN